MSSRPFPEILAPAGNMEMLRTAVMAGADAVYLGFSGFNARASAGNFDAVTLADAVRFCHARGVKVHVALNTTVYTGELPNLSAAITAAARCGADAFIVQDLAAAVLARRAAPGVPLHASTQMTIHTLEGAKKAAAMGFSRVILARELTRSEIETITRNCGIETEIFIHGALCMSVSGQCAMSAFLGGRSGNRGSCAGTCRLPFNAAGRGEAFHLSLKDNSLIDRIPEIAAMGVASLKIEGRLRAPEYVAAAVTAARCSRDGLPFDEALLKGAFSRSGFTDGFYTGRRTGDMFGVRTRQDTELSRKVAPRIHELYRREFSRVPVRFTLTAGPNGAELQAADADGHSASASFTGALEPPRTDPVPALQAALAKTGGTPFVCAGAEVQMPEGPVFLPGSEANALRRTCLDELMRRREQLPDVPTLPVPLPDYPLHPLATHHTVRMRFASVSQATQGLMQSAGQLVFPVAQWQRVPEEVRGKTILELPRVQFGPLEELTARLVAEASNQGFLGFAVHNLAHFNLCKGLPMFGDIGLNITNALSASAYAKMGLKGLTASPELTLDEMQTIAPGVPVAALAYGYMPLMVTRACPLQNITDCSRCSKRGTLTDRKNMNFEVRCANGVRTLYNSVPIYMAERTAEMPADVLVLYFTTESPLRAEEVARRFAAGQPFDGPFTRGLYYRGTQSGNDAFARSKA